MCVCVCVCMGVCVWASLCARSFCLQKGGWKKRESTQRYVTAKKRRRRGTGGILGGACTGQLNGAVGVEMHAMLRFLRHLRKRDSSRARTFMVRRGVGSLCCGEKKKIFALFSGFENR